MHNDIMCGTKLRAVSVDDTDPQAFAIYVWCYPPGRSMDSLRIGINYTLREYSRNVVIGYSLSSVNINIYIYIYIYIY